MSKSNELQKYFEAGWNLNFSENPPYASSPIGLAFAAGVWARKHSLPCGEIKSSRGYKMIVNRDYILDFKDSDCNPNVTKKQTVV